MLVIAVCAVMAGAETWVDIAHYGQLKQAWLATFLDLPGGIPSHDTFRRVFSLLDPQQVEQCFRQWMATVAPPLPREVVAVDGKTIRRSFDRGRAQGPLHVVSAFATAQGLSLGQVAVTGKGQELAAIPVLLSSLHLTNTIVTLDALGGGGLSRGDSIFVYASNNAPFVHSVSCRVCTTLEFSFALRRTTSASPKFRPPPRLRCL